ncbi:MAG: phosphatidate cytidylyltransferase [Alphaproteobacteria bacterium]|nr:phosphatidate cytidylyltransferase [Alphaproteobacteria bacterium]
MAFNLKQEFLRKLIHLSSFWMVAMVWLLPRVWCILMLCTITTIVLIAEYETHKNSLCGRIYRFLFSSVLREKEKDAAFGFSGAAYVLIAALLLVVIMPKVVVMFALSVLLLCDTAAALVGRAIGHYRIIGKKTIEGTVAFVLSGMIVCMLFNWGFGLPVYRALIGVFLGCMGDLLNEKIHIDDNLSIPLLTALPFLF